VSGRQQSESALICLVHHSVIKEDPQMREQLFHQLRRQLSFAAKKVREWFRTKPQLQRRLISGGVGFALVAILALVAAMPAITSASEVDALGNGGFEQGFHEVSGCGVVGNHWDCFTNGGAAAYGFYDDQWESVVYEGKHSQLIEISTKNMAAGDNDRYAGISQTTRVIPGKPYKFSMRGIIRTTNLEGDPWRYSVQVGWLGKPQGDWRDVTNWVEVGWNTYYNRTEPGAFSAFQTQLVPDSEVITIFVRVWKKWGVPYEELDVNIDAISLTGPAVNRPHDGPRDGSHDGPKHSDGVGGPVQGQEYQPEQFHPQGPQAQGPQQQGPHQQENRPQEYRPQEQQSYRPVEPSHDYPVSCGGEELIYNGSFEAGFNDVAWGVVGKGWDAFTNGGGAAYGFYDEEWDVVVADGNHGQLIEISTKSIYPTDADRYAGIYQRIGGLHPGATYELSLRGELRGEGNEDDPYRFAAQWGLGKNPDWQSVDEWTTMDLGPIALRTQPVPLASYKVQFEAPSSSVVLFIRGWKKFAITNVEMDLNLDAISLRACDNKGPQKHQDQGGRQEAQYPGTGGPVNYPGDQQGNQGQGHPNREDRRDDRDYDHDDGRDPDQYPGGNCLYVVKPGDTLSQIAVDFGVSMDAIARANGIDDPSAIYVGQKFEIPGCKGGDHYSEPDHRASYEQEQQPQEYEIVEGERPQDTALRTGPMIRPTTVEDDTVELYPVEDPQVLSLLEEQQRQQSELTYTVQEGDMLSWIAQEHGVNAFDLATYNGIDNLNFIYAGQVLVIPN
jgi:LysM repeat protein